MSMIHRKNDGQLFFNEEACMKVTEIKTQVLILMTVLSQRTLPLSMTEMKYMMKGANPRSSISPSNNPKHTLFEGRRAIWLRDITLHHIGHALSHRGKYARSSSPLLRPMQETMSKLCTQIKIMYLSLSRIWQTIMLTFDIPKGKKERRFKKRISTPTFCPMGRAHKEPLFPMAMTISSPLPFGDQSTLVVFEPLDEV
ncbi:hypothetical protein CR513_12123, partial [Mucuna pruriens]